MRGTFSGVRGSLDLSGLDTSNVTDMSGMFSGMSASDESSGLSLNLSGWDTSNVTDMSGMFSGMSGLEWLDLNLSGWDTGNVTDMHGMFSGLPTGVWGVWEVSSWDTSNVTDMGGMFSNATLPWDVDMSGWDTSSVTNMSGMFSDASLPWDFDVSDWDTSNVTNMSSMFFGATLPWDLDVSSWDTGNVTNMGGMFSSVFHLMSLDLSEWDTRGVSDMWNMFERMYSLTSLVLGRYFELPTWSRNDTGLPIFSGYRWVNETNPAVTDTFTSRELMANFDGATMYGTWTRQPGPTVTAPRWIPNVTGWVGVTFADWQVFEAPLVGGSTAGVVTSISGLPTGIVFDPVTFTFSGTPVAEGSYEVTVTFTLDGAYDPAVSDSATFRWTIALPSGVEHSITVDAWGGTASSSVSEASAGTLVTLTAVPDEWHRFADWSIWSLCGSNVVWAAGSSATSNPATFVMPDSSVSISSHFSWIHLHWISLWQAPGGSASVSVYEAEAGMPVTLTATPDEGYRFANWYFSGWWDVTWVDGSWLGSNPATFYMPHQSVWVAPVFEPTPAPVEYLITVDTVAGGAAMASAPRAPEGASVRLLALPGAGQRFVSWDVPGVTWADGSSAMSNPATFVMPDGPVTVTPEFAVAPVPVAHPVTVNAAAGGAALASPDSAAEGASVTLLALPGVNQRFVRWNVSGVVWAAGSSATSNPATFVMPNAPVTVTPEFVATPIGSPSPTPPPTPGVPSPPPATPGTPAPTPSPTPPVSEWACPTTASFSDVAVRSQFHCYVEWLAATEITTGWPDGTFRPGANVERQAMAAFLYRGLADSAAFTTPQRAQFSDKPTNGQFFRQVEWLAGTGITTGWPDGTFRPGNSVERQAMAAFLFRAAGSPSFTPPATPTFSDVPRTSQFFLEIEWLYSTGITTGFADGTFRPGANVERQAMAAFLYRAFDGGHLDDANLNRP